MTVATFRYILPATSTVHEVTVAGDQIKPMKNILLNLGAKLVDVQNSES